MNLKDVNFAKFAKLENIDEEQNSKEKGVQVLNMMDMVTVVFHPHRIAPTKVKMFYDAYFGLG